MRGRTCNARVTLATRLFTSGLSSSKRMAVFTTATTPSLKSLAPFAKRAPLFASRAATLGASDASTPPDSSECNSRLPTLPTLDVVQPHARKRHKLETKNSAHPWQTSARKSAAKNVYRHCKPFPSFANTFRCASSRKKETVCKTYATPSNATNTCTRPSLLYCCFASAKPGTRNNARVKNSKPYKKPMPFKSLGK